MESVSRSPRHPALDGVVTSFWVSVRPGAGPDELILPSGQAQLVVDGDRSTTLVVGPRSRSSVVSTSRFAAGASFGPVGLSLLTTVPPSKLVDEVVDADEVLQERSSQSLAASDPSEILDRLEVQMLTLRREASGIDRMVVAAERSIRAGSGLDAVTSETGVDRRRFVPAFRQRIGLAPKRYQRVLRFQRALRAMRVPAPETLATIAARCGYADQAHLSRDFKQFSGLTPRKLHGAASTAHNHLPARGDDAPR